MERTECERKIRRYEPRRLTATNESVQPRNGPCGVNMLIVSTLRILIFSGV